MKDRLPEVGISNIILVLSEFEQSIHLLSPRSRGISPTRTSAMLIVSRSNQERNPVIWAEVISMEGLPVCLSVSLDILTTIEPLDPTV